MAERAPDAPAGGVRAVTVAPEEAELRLDRWFKRHFPSLSHGRLEKLLRTGQVRVDGKRSKAGHRLVAGQTIRIPPMEAAQSSGAAEMQRPPLAVDEVDAEALRNAVLYRDDMVIAINKPTGLAVQGGTRTTRHLDGMLDALRFGSAERPRLVHRLDRDTSGVLILGRTAGAAAMLARAFRQRSARKLYWAVTVGTPTPLEGRIDQALAKGKSRGGERMTGADAGAEARAAVTLYRVAEHAGKEAALVALSPLTGRTHQLRVHLAERGTPILGDGKYGGPGAFLPGRKSKLHLHARRLVLPLEGRPGLDITAPPPPQFVETLKFFGFSTRGADTLFDEPD